MSAASNAYEHVLSVLEFNEEAISALWNSGIDDLAALVYAWNFASTDPDYLLESVSSSAFTVQHVTKLLIMHMWFETHFVKICSSSEPEDLIRHLTVQEWKRFCDNNELAQQLIAALEEAGSLANIPEETTLEENNPAIDQLNSPYSPELISPDHHSDHSDGSPQDEGGNSSTSNAGSSTESNSSEAPAVFAGETANFADDFAENPETARTDSNLCAELDTICAEWDDLVADLDRLSSEFEISDEKPSKPKNDIKVYGNLDDIFAELDDLAVELDCLLSESTIPDEKIDFPAVVDETPLIIAEKPTVSTDNIMQNDFIADIGQLFDRRSASFVRTIERHSVNFDAPPKASGGQGGHMNCRVIGHVMSILRPSKMEDNHTKGEPPPRLTSPNF